MQTWGGHAVRGGPLHILLFTRGHEFKAAELSVLQPKSTTVPYHQETTPDRQQCLWTISFHPQAPKASIKSLHLNTAECKTINLYLFTVKHKQLP